MKEQQSAVKVFQGYSEQDKAAARDLLAELKAKQINASLLDVVKAVEPDMETPDILKSA